MTLQRRIRSFVRREGRLTPSQQRALEQVWPQVGLSAATPYTPPARCVLEIGFGMGQSLIQNALDNPETHYIGIEVHRPGVGHLLLGIEKHDIKNIRVFAEDAIDVLTQAIPNHSLDGMQIFFADPWPKKRHHKRRLIQTEFLNLLQTKLKPRGWLHLATDWQPYAEHMLETLTAHPAFQNTAEDGTYIPRPESRPLTKFEKRGLDKGHGVYDLYFICGDEAGT
ncbi:MAG: tRNA (guanine-N(7)-)-methyltransferase [marine bacterium B5-7]|nr:MAG: tRNA (guanine-N(7)-)-methyltransferase [marine bacterium B5-7]